MKITIKLFAFISILFLLQSCKTNSKEDNEAKSLEKKKSEFNEEKEFLNINTSIKKNLCDSISNNNYKYWLKDGKIIKLNVFEGDGENYVTSEDYYIKDNSNVFAYHKKEINYPNSIDYRALIYFNDSKVIKEDYWISDVKTIKDSVENQLKRYGLTIQNEIILDKETNESKGLLTLLDLSNRYNFDYQVGIKNNDSENKISENENTKSLNEVLLTLTDATFKKGKIYLGEPDKYQYAFGHIEKGFAIYYNIVANQNGKPKHLVLFLRMVGNQWGNNAVIEEIYAINDNEKANFGIHWLNIVNGQIETNAMLDN